MKNLSHIVFSVSLAFQLPAALNAAILPARTIDSGEFSDLFQPVRIEIEASDLAGGAACMEATRLTDFDSTNGGCEALSPLPDGSVISFVTGFTLDIPSGL